MLQVEHVAKKFGDRQVLEDVNLKVNQGDVVVILGPSGSGKTTFLRCLNHLEKVDSGSLKLADKDYDLGKLTKKDILEIRQKTAFVFQHYNLFANKTALENILEGLVIARKIPKEEAIKEADLKEILSAGQMASSWKNFQSYSVIVVKSKEKKEALYDLLPQEAIRQSAVFLLFVGDLNRAEKAVKLPCSVYRISFIFSIP